MSVKLMSQVWESDLPADQKYVLLCLADWANDDGTRVYPSKASIARKTGLSARQVQRHLAAFRNNGLLEIVQRAAPDRPTHYRIRGDRLSPLPDLMGGDTDVSPGETPMSPLGSHPRLPNHQGNHQVEPPKTLDPRRPFDAFWEAYPRKAGKRAASAAFTRALRRAPAKTIISAAVRLAEDPNLPETQFIPHPTTWLNQDRWEDDPLPPRGTGRPDPGADRMRQAIELRREEDDAQVGSNGSAGRDRGGLRPGVRQLPG